MGVFLVLRGLMVSRAIPNVFYLDDKLWMKVRVVVSDNAVVAWCYRDEERVWLNRDEVRRKFKKAYTISAAAHLINISPVTIKSIIKKQMLSNMPESTYDRKTYMPKKVYINEDHMQELRQVAWDILPKNKYGIPYDDTITSAKQLDHLMKLGDDREFIKLDDDQVVRIFREEA